MTGPEPEDVTGPPPILGQIPPGAFGSPLFGLKIGYLIDLARYKGLILFSYAVLIFLLIELIRWAFRLPTDSFGQELCVVVSAGIGTFLGTPVILTLGSKWRKLTVPVVLVSSAGCCILAVCQEAPLRALLLEASVSLVLILALEMLFHHYVKAVNRALKSAKDEYVGAVQDFRNQVDEWNDNHPWGPHVDDPE
jgi:hypothetical protein